MMKMQMRPDKTQLPAGTPLTRIFTAPGSSYVFDRSLYSMYGYLNYDAFLIGAAGGRSGDARGTSTNDIVMHETGAGGGGSLRLQDELINLPVVSSISVGAGGLQGADSTAGLRPSGAGGNGGPSSLNSRVAYGGEGGQPGQWAQGAPGTYYTTLVPRAGNGGGSSAGLGSGGVGSAGSLVVGTSAAVTSDSNTDTNPTTGTYVVGTVAGMPDVIGGGKGGGGGLGAVDLFTRTPTPVRDGADGSSVAAVASGTTTGTQKGGSGGGANLGFLTGTDYYAGTLGQISGGAPGSADGAVAIVVS